jgi:transcriptional regulator with GAF, ATPase, and Fis domain
MLQYSNKNISELWVAVPLKAGNNCPSYIQSFFSKHKNRNTLPFLIQTEDLTFTDELIKIAQRKLSYHNGSSKRILLVKDKKLVERKRYIQLLKEGYHDIIDCSNENYVISYLESFIERHSLIEDILESDRVKNNIVGNSPVWKNFLAEVIEASIFSPGSILLTGESGTGKELVSRLVHTLDERPGKKDLILLDCTTIIPTLSGSEFFGHERGAYTNAMQSREGAFSLADKGTLFLDEIGDLPLSLQAELLRVIQEGTFKKVGSNQWQKTTFRLVCATHRNLRQQAEEGKFRQDLFYRIADFEFTMPSLKNRGAEDIELLARYFLKQFFDKTTVPEMDMPVIDYLVNREYAGNVRELKQLMQRIAMKHTNHKKITIGEIPFNDLHVCEQESPEIDNDIYLEISFRKAILSGASLWELKDKAMDTAIRAALQLCNGSKKLAAEKLDVTVRAIQQHLKSKHH